MRILFLLISLFFCLLSTVNAQQSGLKKQHLITFEKVLTHFKTDPNPLKLKAASFLLENMSIHKSIVPYWQNAIGTKKIVSEFDYPSFENAVHAFDSLTKAGFKNRLTVKPDVNYLTADFLIDTIETSFKAWEQSPWFNQYSFETFCEYILPYRNTVEPIAENWKKKYHEKYKNVLLQESSNDPVEACTGLIQSMEYFQFIKKRDYPQPALSVDQVHFRGAGNCNDLAGAALLCGRALGLATTYDFTPHYAASSNSHFWNTVVDTLGNHIPFNGTGDFPYAYNAVGKRMGKVLRYTYSKRPNSLPNYTPLNKIPEAKLKFFNVLDVTEEYTTTQTLKYKYTSALKDNIGYLTVYNKGYWKTLWWGKTTKKNTVAFKKMGTNVVYLPAHVIDTVIHRKKQFSLLLEPYPILVSSKGKTQLLKPNLKHTFNCELSRTNEVNNTYNDFNTLELHHNEVYKLYYWNKKWQLLATEKCSNGSLALKNLPKNALFKLEPQQPDSFERIFTLNASNCKIEWF